MKKCTDVRYRKHRGEPDSLDPRERELSGLKSASTADAQGSRRTFFSDDDQTTRHHRRSTVEANYTHARHRRQAAPPEKNTIKVTALPHAFAAMSAPPERNSVKATAPPQAFAATPAPPHLLQDW
ncbi:hypothetical protein KSP39_PZI023685 [Platanthera zijinensis]|uniref:Uncharacterized protein n=1 Tax=Platanthera zijinensis TaxID=2320716 RepID=A0AAP0ASQ3_9ASPA